MRTDPRVAYRVAAGAARAGPLRSKQRAIGSYEWDRGGRCQRPVFLSINGRDYRDRPQGHPVVFTDIWVRCRRCAYCLQSRRREWTARASYEIMRAQRTWFCTYTLKPEEHYRAICAAAVRIPGLREMSEEIQFRERVRQSMSEFTRYFKRVRKESGAKLRYCLVTEAHRSGLPHFHALVHETPGSKPVLHTTLRGQWGLGYTKFNLVKETDHAKKIAGYTAKYLSKSVLARVRASQRYGDSLELSTNVVLRHNERREPENGMNVNTGFSYDSG